MGENIAITNNPTVNFTALTEGWYNERSFYDVMSSQCVEKQCLHYTQVCGYSFSEVYSLCTYTGNCTKDVYPQSPLDCVVLNVGIIMCVSTTEHLQLLPMFHAFMPCNYV